MYHIDRTFEVRYGKLSISDPLYLPDGADCAVYDLAARNGTWRVEVVANEYGSWGQRIAELRCRHSTVPDVAEIDRLISDDIGVDAATVCVFETPEGIEEAHMSEDSVVVGPHGACSTSGIGDGTYTAYGRYDDGELVAVRVVYIPDSEGRLPSDRRPERR